VNDKYYTHFIVLYYKGQLSELLRCLSVCVDKHRDNRSPAALLEVCFNHSASKLKWAGTWWK